MNRQSKSVIGIQLFFLAGSFFFLCYFPFCWKKKLNADQLWYFFASRNHRVYPICREEAVRLLRSTRMARAYSEGAYSSDYDYERYWHALQLHLCIRHLVVSSSCPSSVFNLSVIIRVMTEKDILSDIGFCWRVITALKLCWCKIMIHNCLCMLRLRAICVADVSCVYTGCWVKCWPAPDCFSVDVLVYVPMYIIPTAVCWSVVCVIFSVVLFYMLSAAAYCSPVQWHLWCIALGCTVAL